MKNMEHITLKGQPISTNNCYRTRGNYRFITNKARALKEDYQWQTKIQWKKPPLKEKLEMDIKIYFGTRRESDWDNFHKLSMDALQGIVFDNDNQIRKATVELFYDKSNPRIELTIKEYGKIKE